MTTISTTEYLLDQAKRRFTPTVNTIPGMGLLEKRLLNVDWTQRPLAEPPAGSGLKPVLGDSGLPILGHLIEMFREGPDFPLHLYRTRGPVFHAQSPAHGTAPAARRRSPASRRRTAAPPRTP